MSPSTYYWRLSHPKQEPKPRGGRPILGFTWTTDGKRVDDECVKELLHSAIEGDGYPYGYRKLTHWLRREHNLVINHKKVYRLCKEMKILRPQRLRRPHWPRRIARNREVTGVNQVWETDIKYGYIAGENRLFFIQTVLDVYDRMVVYYHIGLSCTGREAAAPLVGAYAMRDKEFAEVKPVIRSNNGPQFTSKTFAETCKRLGLEHECIPVQTPNKQAHIEAFRSILEEECLSQHDFNNFSRSLYYRCRVHRLLQPPKNP